MDGYIVDPKGTLHKPCDWDQKGLEQVASDFCRIVTSAGQGKLFGVTSHYRAKLVFPNLPWAQFFERATVLLPQAYWRTIDEKTGLPAPIGKGPAHNFNAAIDAWVAPGGKRGLISPMAAILVLLQ